MAAEIISKFPKVRTCCSRFLLLGSVVDGPQGVDRVSALANHLANASSHHGLAVTSLDQSASHEELVSTIRPTTDLTDPVRVRARPLRDVRTDAAAFMVVPFLDLVTLRRNEGSVAPSPGGTGDVLRPPDGIEADGAVLTRTSP